VFSQLHPDLPRSRDRGAGVIPGYCPDQVPIGGEIQARRRFDRRHSIRAVDGIHRRAVVVTAVLVASTPSAAALARSGESVHSLRSVEAAFYRSKLPFSQDWTPHPPNPYLVPPPRASPVQVVPAAIRSRLTGWAGGGNSTTFKSWQVFVFDGSTAAIAYAAVQRAACKPRSCSTVVLRANNVIYFGDPFPSALRAISELRHE
jgi:hypothetical protein